MAQEAAAPVSAGEMQRIEAARAVNFQREQAADLRNRRQAEQQLATANAAPASELSNGAEQEEVSFQQQRLRQQTQNARAIQKMGSGDGSLSSNIFQAFGGGQDDIKDLILLSSAVIEFWAVWPPLALLASYHVRGIGGKRSGSRPFGGEILNQPLGLLNDFLEKTVMPAGKSLSGAIGGTASGATGGAAAGAGSKFADLGTGAGSDIADIGGGNMSGLNVGQVALMLVCDAVLLVGCITASPFLITILLGVGALGGATGAFCSAAPDVCSTILSALGSTFSG